MYSLVVGYLLTKLFEDDIDCLPNDDNNFDVYILQKGLGIVSRPVCIRTNLKYRKIFKFLRGKKKPLKRWNILLLGEKIHRTKKVNYLRTAVYRKFTLKAQSMP